MTTKAIRNFIDEAGDRCPELRDLALVEVEAIEKAAARRASLAEAVSEGDTSALESLAEMACEERNSTIASEAER